MTDQERIKAEGCAAGLASPSGLHCPYDGRSRAGKAWWDGFTAGDAERCASKQSQPAATTRRLGPMHRPTPWPRCATARAGPREPVFSSLYPRGRPLARPLSRWVTWRLARSRGRAFAYGRAGGGAVMLYEFDDVELEALGEALYRGARLPCCRSSWMIPVGGASCATVIGAPDGNHPSPGRGGAQPGCGRALSWSTRIRALRWLLSSTLSFDPWLLQQVFNDLRHFPSGGLREGAYIIVARCVWWVGVKHPTSDARPFSLQSVTLGSSQYGLLRLRRKRYKHRSAPLPL